MAFAYACLSLSAQVKMPQPSPTQTIRQEFGLGTIELTYSRPGAKDRKIFGDLVPFNKLWRTGANAATLISFTEPVEIKGKKVDTGTYAMYTIPGTDSWEVILNKGVKNWGVDGYDESQNIVRVNVSSGKLASPVETFTMQFTDVKPESCSLLLTWDKTSVSIPLTTSIREKMRAGIESGMQTDKKPNWQAAQYYYEYEKNPAKALEYISSAVETNKEAFWMWLYKAKIEKDLGKKDAALASAKRSLELATEQKNDDYIKMNEDLIKKLK